MSPVGAHDVTPEEAAAVEEQVAAQYASQVTSAGCACDDPLDPGSYSYDPWASSIVSSGPNDSAAGLLLAAARAGKLRPFGFVEVKLPHRDLIVTVLREPLQAMVDGEWLALGVSGEEQKAICQVLGLLPPTAEIVDAAYEGAQFQIAGKGLRRSDADDARMHSIGFAKAHNANVRAAIAAKTDDPDAVVRDWGKSLPIHPKMLERGFVEYGWRGADGRPIQPLGSGGHNASYADYSQLTENLCLPTARRVSDESVTVDLFDEYKRWFQGAAMAAIIDSYRSPNAAPGMYAPVAQGAWDTSLTSAGADDEEEVLATWSWTIQYDTTERPARLVRTSSGNIEIRFDAPDGRMRQVPVDVAYQPPRLDRIPAGLTNLQSCGQEVAYAVRVLLGYVLSHNLPLGTVIPFYVEKAYAARLEVHSNAPKGLSTYAGTPEGASA
jgi:hypothetical protein